MPQKELRPCLECGELMKDFRSVREKFKNTSSGHSNSLIVRKKSIVVPDEPHSLAASLEYIFWAGVLEDMPASPLINSHWIKCHCQSVSLEHEIHSDLRHCIQQLGPRLSPFPEFDAYFYGLTNADVALEGVYPIIHWLQFGIFEGRPISSGHRPKPHWAAHLDGNERMRALREVPAVMVLLSEISAGEISLRLLEKQLRHSAVETSRRETKTK